MWLDRAGGGCRRGLEQFSRTASIGTGCSSSAICGFFGVQTRASPPFFRCRLLRAAAQRPIKHGIDLVV